jgi:serine/threonine-protein kinase HipA
VLEEAIGRTPGAIEQVRGLIPRGFPEQIADSVFKGLTAAAKQLADER